MSDLLALPPATAWLAVAACMLAGAIRGFAGFGLSALVVAILAPAVPPVELVPALWFLEMAASLALMRGGWADADRPAAVTLTVAAGLALPVGLGVSLALAPTVSKTAALLALVALAAAQLARLRLPALATRPGTAATGVAAGLVTGVAGAGGMVIALYALARDLPARTMRGTLNIYLLGAGVLGLAAHVVVGTMTATAATRGIALAVPALAGVAIGRALFTPRWERYYKPACLTLLIGLAAAGLARLALEPR